MKTKRQPINFDFSAFPENIVNSVTDGESRYGIVKNEDGDGPAEILMFDQIGSDFIGGGVTAQGVVDFLNESGDRDILVRINSPGGLAFEGITIHNALAQHDAHVTTRVEGMAASAASIVMVAGDDVEIMENASIMVHRALTIAFGNQTDMRDTAEMLNSVDNQIITTYAAQTGLSINEISDLMDGEVDGTTLSAKDAVDKGFADKVIKIKSKKKSKSSNSSEAATRTRNYLKLQANARLREIEMQTHAT